MAIFLRILRVLSPTPAVRVPGSLDLAKNISFLDWKLASAQILFVDGL
jgi:hypothetical protein